MTLDLDHLEAVARAAMKIYDRAKMFTDEGWPEMEEVVGRHVATFDPPTVLAMLERLRYLEAWRERASIRLKGLNETPPDSFIQEYPNEPPASPCPPKPESQ